MYNNIVIIGNGFDIAHNLDTDYQSFMKHMLKTAIEESITNSNNISENELFKVIHKTPQNFLTDKKSFLNSFNSVEDIIKNEYVRAIFLGGVGKPKDFFHLHSDSRLMINVLSDYSINKWVDIEDIYFNLLYSIAVEEQNHYNKKAEEVRKLNAELQILAESLKKYLIGIQESNQLIKIDDSFKKNMSKLIFPELKYERFNSGATTSTLILNYNYTNTLQNYISLKPEKYRIKVLNLHGQLDDSRLPIFGFGHVPDDTKFRKLEQSGIPGVLNNIKIYNYNDKRSDYSQLRDFLNMGEYNVRVIGHSCGVSDGTTLRSIFENQNCQNFSIGHRAETSYQRKIENIRHRCSSEDVINKHVYNDQLIIPNLKKI